MVARGRRLDRMQQRSLDPYTMLMYYGIHTVMTQHPLLRFDARILDYPPRLSLSL